MARLEPEFWDTPVLLRRFAADPVADPIPVITGIRNVCEAVHRLLVERQDSEATTLLQTLPSVAQDLTPHRILSASQLRIREKHRGLSVADAAGYVTARELGARFVTTDRGFDGLPGTRRVRVDGS